MTTPATQNIIIEPSTIFIEGGSFMMGEKKREHAQPIHKVTVPSFYLGQYPVTNEEFLPFLNDQGNQEEGGTNWVNLEGNYEGTRCGIIKSDAGYECSLGLERHPMIYISWYGAQAYCKWLSEKTGKSYRLPSEAEWEYAARGGIHHSPFTYAGSNQLKEVGWYRTNSHGSTKPVGLKLANELDLYDMSGNVDEWCADHWHRNYDHAPDDGSAWIAGGEDSGRVVRGGSWGDDGFNCRVSDRFRSGTNFGYGDIGFRVARY